MIEMHEMIEGQGLDMYHDLGQAAFGKKLGLYIVVPLQLLGEISACIMYMVTGGESLKTVHQLSMGDDRGTKMRIQHFILIFASSQFVLSLLKNVKSISGVSLVAAVMSVSYSTIAWVASLTKGVTEHVEYGYKKRTTSVPLAFLRAFGQIAFSHATIPSATEISSKKFMWKGAIVAYVIVAFCYFPVALVRFMIFGNNVEDNILQSLHDPKGLIILANMFVVLHLLGNYQMYAMPVFGMIESLMIKKWHFIPKKVLRLTIRCTFVAVTMATAIGLPYFNAFLLIFGGFVSTPTTYFVIFLFQICIILGVLVMIVAPIGGLAKLLYYIKI